MNVIIIESDYTDFCRVFFTMFILMFAATVYIVHNIIQRSKPKVVHVHFLLCAYVHASVTCYNCLCIHTPCMRARRVSGTV